jgi:hypothetical protein
MRVPRPTNTLEIRDMPLTGRLLDTRLVCTSQQRNAMLWAEHGQMHVAEKASTSRSAQMRFVHLKALGNARIKY